MEPKDFLAFLEKTALDRAVETVGQEHRYPAAYGFVVGAMSGVLDSLNLTEEQKAVLSRYAELYHAQFVQK